MTGKGEENHILFFDVAREDTMLFDGVLLPACEKFSYENDVM